MLDLEKDICHSPDNGLFMVPHKMSYEESLHFCKKLSGNMFSYTNKTDFDGLIYFRPLQSNMKSTGCIEKVEDSNNIEIWAGGTDGFKEGYWETWNSREPIQVCVQDLWKMRDNLVIISAFTMGKQQAL